MPHTATTGEQPNNSLAELWERKDVLAYFGGKRPLHTSTLYRGIHDGLYPRPIHVSRTHVRWLRSECEAALDRMIAARDEPKLAERRGRPRRKIIT
jgi:predicted DNA-binding transcriptional regulator AlpA